jgi:AcrR family transcriptional regulator
MRRARTDEAKEDRRGAILSAALDEFFERGFAAAKMDDIARRTGVSKGTVYLYYPSKDAVFEALIEAVVVPTVARIEAAAGAAPSALLGIRALAMLAPTLLRTSSLPRLMKVMIGDARTFPDVVRRYRTEVIERILGMIAAMLARAMESGEIRRSDPALTARLVVAPVVLSGVWEIVFNLDGEASVDLEALFALHADTLERALRAEAMQ